MRTRDKLPHRFSYACCSNIGTKPKISVQSKSLTPVAADEATGFKDVVTGPLGQSPQVKTGKGKSFTAPCLTPGSLTQSFVAPTTVPSWMMEYRYAPCPKTRKPRKAPNYEMIADYNTKWKNKKERRLVKEILNAERNAWIERNDFIDHLPADLQFLGFDQNVLDQIWNFARGLKRLTGDIASFIKNSWSSIVQTIKNIGRTLRTTYATSQAALSFLAEGSFWGLLGVLLIWLVTSFLEIELVGRMIVTFYLNMQENPIYEIPAKVFLTSTVFSTTKRFATPYVNVSVQNSVGTPASLQASDWSEMIRTALTCCSVLIIIALGLGVTDAVNIQASLSGLAKRLNDFTLIKRGVESLTDIITTVLKEVTRTLGYEVRGLDENGEVPDDINRWVQQLKTFTTTRKQTLQNDITACAEIDDMNTRYTNMRMKYKDNRVLSGLLDKFQGAIVNLVALAYQVNPCTAKSRVEPVVLMLRGRSGVGKSSLLYHFATQVLAQTNAIAPAMTDSEIQEKIQSCIYPRSAENEYWEGYANQPCTLVDDAFQIVDSTSNPNLDFLELLRMSNPFPYPLHMATLSQKANTNFTSRVVIYTTNVETLRPSSFVAPEAVQRRVTMPYSVHIKTEFADAHGQLLEDFRTGQIDTDVYVFYPWDVNTGRINLNDPRSYEDIVEELSRKMRNNETKFRSQTADLVGVARTMMARQVAPREPVASTSSAVLQFNPIEWLRRNQMDDEGEFIIAQEDQPQPPPELNDDMDDQVIFNTI